MIKRLESRGGGGGGGGGRVGLLRRIGRAALGAGAALSRAIRRRPR